MTPEPIVALSALQHYVYCPRKCALIHVDGMWFDNRHTIRGHHGHRRADTGRSRHERGMVVLRGVPLFSDALGLTGRADVLELSNSGFIVPVEYKMGVPYRDAADVQICAQAMCLEEMTGRPVPHGFVWYATTRRRRRVVFDDLLQARTVEVIEAVRHWMWEERLPPAENDRRCTRCQFSDHCLPDLVAHPERISRYIREEVFACGT